MVKKHVTFNENLKCMRLSFFISENSPVHPDLKRTEIIPKNEISKGKEYNTYFIKVENHCGTHVDAPAHFIKNGRKIANYSPEELIYRKTLYFQCPKKPDELITKNDVSKIKNKDYDCILIGTGFNKYRDRQINTYLFKNPGISPAAVSYIRRNFPNLKCLGIDTISMSRYGRPEEAQEVHITGFIEKKEYGEPLLFLEDLDLRLLNKETEIKVVIVVPWQIENIDSAPCTVLAEKKRD